MSVEKLIDRSFAARDAAHCAHLKTDSYARHQALGEFYTSLPDMVDEFAESYQGLFGELGELKFDSKEITDELRKELLWLTENREKTTKGVPALQNLHDNISALYMRTIFKLERLG